MGVAGNPASWHPSSIYWQRHSMKHERRTKCERARPDPIYGRLPLRVKQADAHEGEPEGGNISDGGREWHGHDFFLGKRVGG